MNDDFSGIIPRVGQPANIERVPADVLESYRGRVPDGLIDFWADVGWCSFQDGYYWIPDPRLFDGLLQEVFRGDPEFDPPKFVIFKYDAFGKLYGWTNDTKLMTLNIAAYNPNFSVQSQETRPQSERWSDDRYVANSIGLAKEEREYYAEQNLNDFEYALKRLGRLDTGQIYGYSPAFALGGEGSPETLIRAPIVEHLLMLAQMTRIAVERYVLDVSDPSNPLGRRERVREIGPVRE